MVDTPVASATTGVAKTPQLPLEYRDVGTSTYGCGAPVDALAGASPVLICSARARKGSGEGRRGAR